MKLLSITLITLFTSFSAFADEITLTLPESKIQQIVADFVDLDAQFRPHSENPVFGMIGPKVLRARDLQSEANAEGADLSSKCTLSDIASDSAIANCTVQVGKIYLRNVPVAISNTNIGLFDIRNTFNGIDYGYGQGL